jgi:uncharacterized repeat protein (TIGR02543 family)
VASGATLSRAGFTFAGWHDGTNPYAAGSSYTMGTSNVTLTAQWTALGSFTVTFNANGGTGTMTVQTTNVPTALTLNAFTRAGYSFSGWNTLAVGGGTAYANGAIYPFTANVTLYAQWTANPTHTVTYANGGGTGTLPTQSPVAEGASFTVASGATLSRAGFTFAGWHDGTNPYAAGSSYTMGTSNVTLTAQWTALPSFTVTFDANTGSGTMTAQTSNVAANLTLNTFTKAGFSFNGWNTQADGLGTNYADGALYPFTANITLYAQWTATAAIDLNVTANNKIIIFGGADPVFDFSVTGFVSPDTFLVTPKCLVADPHSAVGTYPIVCSGGDAGTKYNIIYHDGVLTVSAKIILNVTASSASMTYGDAAPVITPIYSGFTGTDDPSVLNTAPLCSVTGPFTVGGSPFVSSCSGGVDDKYDFNYINGSVTVNKAGLTVTADNKVRAFGGAADPAFTFTLTGLKNGETAAVIDSAPTCIVTVAHGAPGNYPITCTGGSDNNYNFTSYVPGTLTVSGVNSATFIDVPMSHWAWHQVESLYAFGITTGCATNPLAYCPTETVTRAQMAVFLLRAKYGSSYAPPALGSGGTGFTDVPVTHWAAAWIKQLAVEGITTGCGPSIYCPESAVNRDQMAIFLLRVKHSSSYTPPALGSGGTGFTDVPVTHWAAAWIKQLAAEGITTGCGVGLYCPSAPVSRAEMAMFLVRTFSLPIP